MLERGHDAAELGEPLEPPDRRIARLAVPPEVVEDVLAVVGAEGNRGVGAAGGAAPRLLLDDARR